VDNHPWSRVRSFTGSTPAVFTHRSFDGDRRLIDGPARASSEIGLPGERSARSGRIGAKNNTGGYPSGVYSGSAVLIGGQAGFTGGSTAVHGYSGNKEDHLRRLRRIEGQIRGLQRMIEGDQYCIDVLTQIAAATRALQSVSIVLLEEHLQHCVRQAVSNGNRADEKIKEASEAIARLVRS
jgi:DNA-binding FrmR family transcriptional regulator